MYESFDILGAVGLHDPVQVRDVDSPLAHVRAEHHAPSRLPPELLEARPPPRIAHVAVEVQDGGSGSQPAEGRVKEADLKVGTLKENKLDK